LILRRRTTAQQKPKRVSCSQASLSQVAKNDRQAGMW
jgi:hypothetical protein